MMHIIQLMYQDPDKIKLAGVTYSHNKNLIVVSFVKHYSKEIYKALLLDDCIDHSLTFKKY